MTQHVVAELLSEREAARKLGVSLPTLRRYRREGRPLCSYIRATDKRVAYDPADIAAAVAMKRVPAAGEAEAIAAAGEAEIAAAGEAETAASDAS